VALHNWSYTIASSICGASCGLAASVCRGMAPWVARVSSLNFALGRMVGKSLAKRRIASGRLVVAL